LKKAKVEKVDGKVLVPNCSVAEGSWERNVGLLRHKSLAAGEGLWIDPCNAIHTFFMRFAIDAIFLSKNLQVVKIKANVEPWRITGVYWRARSVLELPAGEARRLGIRIGDELKMREMN
jgi:uncharacterized membrane protein (UPF0127 family)